MSKNIEEYEDKLICVPNRFILNDLLKQHRKYMIKSCEVLRRTIADNKFDEEVNNSFQQSLNDYLMLKNLNNNWEELRNVNNHVRIEVKFSKDVIKV